MPKKLPQYLALLMILFVCASNALAQTDAPFSYLHSVQLKAEQFVTDQITLPEYGSLTVSAAQLDNRLRISECEQPLNLTIPGKSSLTHSVNVHVRCPYPEWQLYVPVRISLSLPLVVTTKPLARGDVIGPRDVQVALREQRFQRGMTYTEPQHVVGAKVRRNLNAGDIVQGNNICLVCRNEAVTIRAGQSGLAIITPGTALSDGLLGDQIRVQNNKSRRIIDAKITGVGEVSVNY